MTYPVKWYSSDMEGAPTMGTTAQGGLVALLKAVLVTGFGSKSVDSITYDSGNNECIATISAGHSYLKDSVVEISGADQSEYDGEQRITWASSTQFKYTPASAPSITPATGTITVKIPPLGWQVLYEDGNGEIAIFERLDANATPICLRVDNSAYSGWDSYSAYLAKVAMVEDVVDLNTYTTVYEHRWPATHYLSSSEEWQLVGDGLLFFFLPTYGNLNHRGVYLFGDINSIRAGDNYHCVMTHYPVTTNNSVREWNNTSDNYFNNSLCFADVNHKRIARNHHQLPGSDVWQMRGLFSYVGSGLVFPNPADNGFYLSTESPMVLDGTGAYRGTLPGIVAPYATHPAYDKTNLENLPSFPGKLIRLLSANRDENANLGFNNTLVGFDLTGPWRV